MDRGLYIHIPFCTKKCPYCGFYSISGADSLCVDRYVSAMLAELRSLDKPGIDTIYIGGGTPSYIGNKLTAFIRELLGLIHYGGKEFTVEVNPESVGAELCRELGELPVSRVSMGAQNTADSVLAMLGRPHDAKHIYKAYDLLRKHLTAAVNLDIIYDIPGVEWGSVRQTAKKIITLAPEHISAYSYSPDTGYLTDEASENPFQMKQILDLMEDNGYKRYEISNFARPGRESVHNIKYWDMDEYIGVGASAHSMAYDEETGRRVRYCHKADIGRYMAAPSDIDEPEAYSREDSAKESVIFGLRQTKGVDLNGIGRRYNCAFDESFLKKIDDLCAEGMLEREEPVLRATSKGFLLLHSIQRYLW